ncbi:hypothetical protein [Paraburkholderia xenovorans]|uniref:hypothetical protein n=1 Tax=Paraburkholderia xenovorans TaxID=36873 RepID=UPI0015C55C24|nr:hypothetical protein [Paraburkholderia xenovorans]NPT35685.1 hypothetical protein [Paraburkholderia xenovorans]
MKSLILSYGRLTRAPFMARALVGLLTFAAAVLIEVFLDAVWTHFHINLAIADRFVQAIAAPIVGLMIAPMLTFLAQFFDGERSVRPQPSWQYDHFSRWDDDEISDLYKDHDNPTYSWIPGNLHHDDS